MKRNLLNVAMFGLLAAAVPASTFVSCKDYDEDFSQIKATMKSDKQALMDADAAIQKQVTALEGKLATVNETLDNLKKQQGTNTEGIKNNAEAIKACAEDIAKLKTAIDTYKKTQDEIRAAVEKLQNDKLDASKLVEINAGITAAQSAADAAKTDAAAAKTAADAALVEAKKGVKAAADAAQAAQVADGKATAAQAALDAYKAEAKKLFDAQAQTLANYKAELDELAAASSSDDTSERIEALAAELAKVKATADAAQTQAQVAAAVDVAIQKITALEKQVQANVNVMEVVGKLKSMEIETAYSYNGIEAIETALYELKKLAPANAADANKVNYARAHVDGALAFPTKTALDNYIPATYAVYNLNPSTAKVKADKANFKFLGLNQILDSRAGTAGFVVPAIDTVEVNGGQARVKLNLDASRSTIKTGVAASDPQGGLLPAFRHVSSIALRYSEGDTTVTSSYAALVANTYDELALYQVNRPGLLETDFASRGDAHNLTVSYKDTLDLSKVIATQRKLKDEGYVFWDENAAQANNPVVAAGFKYQFDIVKKDNNDQTYFYFKLDRNTGRLIPTDASGNVKKQASVDRMAHIRVSLVKGEDIVAVGYFDVKVTGEVIEERVNSMTADYTLSCDDNEYVLNNHERFFGGAFKAAADKIGYNDSQMTSDRWKKFTFEMHNGTIATYTKDENSGAFTKDQTPKFDITLKNGQINTKTFIVKAKQSVADVMKNTGDKIDTYVKLTNPQHIEIYLKLTWQPANVYNNPSVDYAADHKPIDNAYIQQDGRREFRVNTGKAHKYDFSYDLTEGFTGNKVAIEFKAPSPYATALAGNVQEDKFVFVEPTTRYVEGGSGARYVVEVGAESLVLNATKVNAQNAKVGDEQEIVKLEGDKIKFAALEYAQDILNKYSRNEMEDGQTFTAYIKRVADYCKKGKAITVTNNQFAVRFIRPINITAATVEVIDDGKQPEQLVSAVINFTDWRNVNFKDEPGLYAAENTGYKVSKIEAEAKDKWTTDLDGGTLGSTSLTAKNAKLKLEWVAPQGAIDAVNSGKVKYTANNAVTTEFKVRIPLKVTYRWGIIRTYVDVNIKPTVK